MLVEILCVLALGQTPAMSIPQMEKSDVGIFRQAKIMESWEIYLRAKYREERPHTEPDWCKLIALKYDAMIEVRLFDASRVDLLNDEYALEVDWAGNWEEAIGQSLWYAIVTEKKPGVVLLVKNPDRDEEDIHKALIVCEKTQIKLYLEDVSKYMR